MDLRSLSAIEKVAPVLSDATQNTPEAYEEILRDEFPFMTIDNRIKAILEFEKELNNLAYPDPPQLYPSTFRIQLGHLRQIAAFINNDTVRNTDAISPRSFYRGVKTILLSHYKDAPKVATELSEKLCQQLNLPEKKEKSTTTREWDHHWQKQLSKCLQVLNSGPILFIKGSSGVGKSYITEAIQRTTGAAEVSEALSMGPSAMLTDECLETAITEWAKPPEGSKPRYLVLDEANLSPEDFWNFLSGLYENPPYIWLSDKKIPLTPQHKIIMTGNQDRMPGRNIQRMVRERAVTIFFKEFPDTYIANGIMKPILNGPLFEKHKLTEEDKKRIGKQVLAFKALKQKLEPDQVFSPRDYQAILNRLALLKTLYPDNDIKDLLRESLRQTQYGSLSKAQKIALDQYLDLVWGRGTRIETKPSAEFIKRVQRQGGVTVTKSVRAYIKTIEDVLADREHQKKYQSSNFTGKGGVLVQGPSGIGKDRILRATLDAKGEKYEQVNVGMDIQSMVDTINRAKRKGRIVILSEMNLLPSGLLEGRLNAVLTGLGDPQPKPGFFIFGTINPQSTKAGEESFRAKERLSSALLNRLQIENREDYTKKELTDILKNQPLPRDEKSIEGLVSYYLSLKRQLSLSTKPNTPLPTIRELLRAANPRELLSEDPIKAEYGFFDLFLEDGDKEASPEKKADIPPQQKRLEQVLKSLCMLLGIPKISFQLGSKEAQLSALLLQDHMVKSSIYEPQARVVRDRLFQSFEQARMCRLIKKALKRPMNQLPIIENLGLYERLFKNPGSVEKWETEDWAKIKNASTIDFYEAMVVLMVQKRLTFKTLAAKKSRFSPELRAAYKLLKKKKPELQSYIKGDPSNNRGFSTARDRPYQSQFYSTNIPSSRKTTIFSTKQNKRKKTAAFQIKVYNYPSNSPFVATT